MTFSNCAVPRDQVAPDPTPADRDRKGEETGLVHVTR